MKVKIAKACRWLLVSPLLVCAVALGMVVATPTNAHAADATSLVVSGATRAAPTVVGACVATAYLFAACVGAVGVGAYLYGTRDQWIPQLKGLLNGDWREQLTNPNNSCTMNVTGFFQSVTPRQIVGNLLYTQCSGSLYVRAENPTCRTAGGQYANSTALYTWGNVANAQNPNPNEVGYASPNLCGEGLTLTGVTVFGYAVSGGVTGPKYRIGAAYPEADHKTTVDVTCQRPDGSTFDIQANTVGTTERIDIPACYAVDPTSVPKEAHIKGGPNGDIPKNYVDWVADQDAMGDYGDCFTELGLVCNVAVWINGDECVVGDVICKDWQNYQTNHASAVKCQFGGYQVAMSNCAILRHAYKTDVIPVTEVKPGVNEPKLPNEPPVAPPPVCTVNCVTPPTPPDDPENPNPDGDDCLSDMWSWNPVDLVYVPVKCALTWAFVPPAGTFDAAGDRISDAYGDADSGWRDSLEAAFSGVGGGGGGCQGPGFSMPDVLQEGGLPSPFYPFSSCGSTASQVAYWCHLISTVGLVVFGVVKCLELIQAGMGVSTHVGIARSHDWQSDRFS